MSRTDYAGSGGIGLALVPLTINASYVRARLPLLSSIQSLDAVAHAFAYSITLLRI